MISGTPCVSDPCPCAIGAHRRVCHAPTAGSTAGFVAETAPTAAARWSEPGTFLDPAHRRKWPAKPTTWGAFSSSSISGLRHQYGSSLMLVWTEQVGANAKRATHRSSERTISHRAHEVGCIAIARRRFPHQLPDRLPCVRRHDAWGALACRPERRWIAGGSKDRSRLLSRRPIDTARRRASAPSGRIQCTAPHIGDIVSLGWSVGTPTRLELFRTTLRARRDLTR